MARRSTNFSLAVKTEGGMFPTDFLLELAALGKEIEGLKPEQYHLSDREKINEAINQAYSRLQGFWLSFKDTLEKLPIDDYATSATREKWLLPLFDCLGYGRLIAADAVTVGDRQYKPTHMRENVAIHLVGFRVDLDKRSTAGGARTSSPHSLVQELLNQSDEHLWAFVSNGRKLRILRDNVSLTRQAFIEFDIESIFEGDGYADFRLLWLLCHQSRVEGIPPESCWLERWKDAAQLSGVRVRDQLRIGVEKALETFGTGFLQHRANEGLRARVRSGEITSEEYYRQLLRLIYRLLFLFVTEDRDVLLSPNTTTQQRRTYYDYYSTVRLRDLAGKRKGSLHEDLWANLSFVFEKLSSDGGCVEIGLPALGSFLWSTGATPLFEGSRLYNADLLEGIRSLCFTIDSGVRRPVQYGQLESEELGSIYESLLDQIPCLDASSDLPHFGLRQTAGSERKTTGSYYTPTGLVNCLLDSALEPVLERAVRAVSAEDAILKLKVCDPACGSGHFLIAAAHRIAKRLAYVRSGDLEPGPEYIRTALRDVISRCIYGVDVNELAVELCKVSLWLQSAIPGVPLSFLDHKIKCGNSLIGTTPALIENGIPDAAFDPIEGDDKDWVRQIKAANKQQSDGVKIEGFIKYDQNILENSAAILSRIDVSENFSIRELHHKEQAFAQLLTGEAYVHERNVSDGWCSAFVWKLRPGAPPPITREVFGRLRSDHRNLPSEVRNEIIRLREQYKFFNWYVEFPQVFAIPPVGEAPTNQLTGWSGGFDVILGNPPWERINIKEQEWFAGRAPDVAAAQNASIRRRMIADLEKDSPALHRAFRDDQRKADGEGHFVRKSGRFPLCGRGDVNTYSIFAETMRGLISPIGCAGFIVPSGIATDDTTKFFFRDLVEKGSLVSFYDFENRRAVFPGVHRSYKFALVTLAGTVLSTTKNADFVFFALDTVDLQDADRHVSLSAEDLSLVNPNTGTCAIFRSNRDAEIVKSIYGRVPVFVNERHASSVRWRVDLGRMFHMSDDIEVFRSAQFLEAQGMKLVGNVYVLEKEDRKETYLPLFEAKMIHHFDDRWGTYDGATIRDVTLEEKADAHFHALPRYWVHESAVREKLRAEWDRPWLLAFRKICRSTDERTAIATIIPLSGVGDSMQLIYLEPEHRHLGMELAANFSTFAFDYVTRIKTAGTNLALFIVRQLPLIIPGVLEGSCPWNDELTVSEWLRPLCLKLFCSSRELTECLSEFGQVEGGTGWLDRTRFSDRCKMDAAFFHLYGLSRDEVDYVMETFPGIRLRDEKIYGHYETKHVILRVFDAMQEAISGGTPYSNRSLLEESIVVTL